MATEMYTGAAAAWVDSVELFGSGKVSFGEVAEPAIRLAEQGAPTSEINSFAVCGLRDTLVSIDEIIVDAFRETD
jgi:gamma-glutamyltranspeptidase